MMSNWGEELRKKNIETGVCPENEQWLYCSFVKARVCFFYNRTTSKVERISVKEDFYDRGKDSDWEHLFEMADKLPIYLKNIAKKMDANNFQSSEHPKDLVDIILTVYSAKE